MIIINYMINKMFFTGETVVATLFAHAGRFLQEWAAPILSFIWNVILPVLLMVIFLLTYKLKMKNVKNYLLDNRIRNTSKSPPCIDYFCFNFSFFYFFLLLWYPNWNKSVCQYIF